MSYQQQHKHASKGLRQQSSQETLQDYDFSFQEGAAGFKPNVMNSTKSQFRSKSTKTQNEKVAYKKFGV